MCISSGSIDRRGNWQRASANLVAGLLLWNFVPKSTLASHLWLDGIMGIFMGVSIGMNLMLLRRARRNRPASCS